MEQSFWPTDCVWRGTTSSTEKFEVPRDKHKLHLVVIPQSDNTGVKITIVSDGEEQESMNPMLASAEKLYKIYKYRVRNVQVKLS